MISIGRRVEGGDAWRDQSALSRTAAYLRGGSGLVPRGVYRFHSFEEADRWMTRAMLATHARRNRQTASGSAAR